LARRRVKGCTPITLIGDEKMPECPPSFAGVYSSFIRRMQRGFSKLLIFLALPREAHDFNICNVLAIGLGKLSGIDMQDVSAAFPKLFVAVRRDALADLIG
jgi:hypothetical protein